MTQQHDDRAAYEQWLRTIHQPAHARRTAERNAGFFLPQLRPGMGLLDAGCGPGSITLGLAERVAPGETIGIDVAPTAIDAARALATERGAENVRFDVADVMALPFEDATFAAAFAHALLQHLPDPLAGLREMRRVLKPGAVIGLADADHDGWIVYPDDPLLHRSFEIQRELRVRSGGGDPRVGKRLRSLLHDAGFVRVTASTGATPPVTEEGARRMGEWQARYVEAPEFADRVTAMAITTLDELAAIAAAWRAWGAHPGAFHAGFICQALGYVE